MRDQPPGQASPSSGRRLMVPLCLGATLNPINSSIIATALLPISAAMDVSVGSTATLIAALYIASAVGQPVSGKLAHVCGPRRVLISGTLLIVTGGLVGLTVTSLDGLVVARVLIGLGTSTGYPCAMLLIQHYSRATGSPPHRSLGALAIAAQVSVTVGVPLGGLLVSLLGWRSVFAVNLPLAITAGVMTMFLVPRDRVSPTGTSPSELVGRLDLPGVLLFVATVWTGFIFLMDLPNFRGPTLVVAVALAFCLVVWESRRLQPFLDVRLMLRHPALCRTYLRNGGLMLIMYATLFGVSQWLQEVRGLEPERAGLLVIPMTALAAVVSYLASRRSLIKAALIGAAAAATLGTGILLGMSADTHLAIVAIATTILGVMVGLSAIGNQAALYSQSAADDLGVSAGLLRTSTNVGAILAASAVSFAYAEHVTDRQFHGLALLLLTVSATLLIATVADRALPWKRELG